jgi:stage II sporulation protein AA (anti-sigma F factor antagonist)
VDNAPSLEVLESRHHGCVWLTLRGELDLATAGTVAERLQALCETRESVVLDLDELTFMDASGVRLVVTASHRRASDSWVFEVTRGSQAVRRLFAVVGLDRVLPYTERKL